MKIEKTELENCYLLTPNVFGDERGSFCVPFNATEKERIKKWTL